MGWVLLWTLDVSKFEMTKQGTKTKDVHTQNQTSSPNLTFQVPLCHERSHEKSRTRGLRLCVPGSQS